MRLRIYLTKKQVAPNGRDTGHRVPTFMYRKFKRTCSGKARLATTLLKAAEKPDLMSLR